MTSYGAAHRRNRAAYNGTTNINCWLCGQPINMQLPRTDPDSFELDHILPVSTHPELANDPANTRPAHKQCNRARGNRPPKPNLGHTSRNWNQPRKDTP